MNNDLKQFSEERLKDIIEFMAKPTLLDGVLLARIALSAKQAKPVAYLCEWDNGNKVVYFDEAGNALDDDWSVMPSVHKNLPLYTTPQPAHTEQSEMLNKARSLSESIGELRKQIDSSGGYDFEALRSEQVNSPALPDGCQWNADEDLVYSTGCGNEWQFTDGGLEDNKITFCPYCSGKITAPKPESE